MTVFSGFWFRSRSEICWIWWCAAAYIVASIRFLSKIIIIYRLVLCWSDDNIVHWWDVISWHLMDGMISRNTNNDRLFAMMPLGWVWDLKSDFLNIYLVSSKTWDRKKMSAMSIEIIELAPKLVMEAGRRPIVIPKHQIIWFSRGCRYLQIRMISFSEPNFIQGIKIV